MIEKVEQGRAQPLQPRIGDPGLGLGAGGAHHPRPGRPVGQVSEQRGLATARLAAQHQRATVPAPHLQEQVVERLLFGLPAAQHDHAAARRTAAIAPRLRAARRRLASTIGILMTAAPMTTAPLQSMLQPSSSWVTRTWAEAHPGWSMGGHGGWCSHMPSVSKEWAPHTSRPA